MIKNIEQYNELFSKKIYELKKEIKNLPEDFLNSYVICTVYFHQYEMGITGVHRNVRLLVDKNGNGYPYAAAAYKDAKEHGIKEYRKNGEKTPYGEIGAKEFKRAAITVREALAYTTHGTTVYEFERIRKVA